MAFLTLAMDIFGVGPAPATDEDKAAFAEQVRRMALRPRAITAFPVGLRSRIAAFRAYRGLLAGGMTVRI